MIVNAKGLLGQYAGFVSRAIGQVADVLIVLAIIFVPMLSFARPNPADEARIPPIQFKELCGRIAVFLTDDPQGKAFYDFIIFQDESWFAWGYGWPK